MRKKVRKLMPENSLNFNLWTFAILVWIFSMLICVFGIINLFTSYYMYKPKRTDAGKYFGILWWVCFQGLTVVFELFMVIVCTVAVVNHVQSDTHKITIVTILFVFYLLEVIMLSCVMKEFCAMEVVDPVPAVRSDRTISVLSISELLSHESAIDTSVAPIEQNSRRQINCT